MTESERPAEEDDSYLPSFWLPPANGSLESAPPADDDDEGPRMPDAAPQIDRVEPPPPPPPIPPPAPVTAYDGGTVAAPAEVEYVPEPVATNVAPSLNFSAPSPAETSATMPIYYDAAPSTVAVLPPGKSEQVTCPECGRVAMVTLTRRESVDFCESCDYPLFWTPNRILLDAASLYDDSLRRLPGTVGRVAIASLPCPHCAEPNQVTAVNCVRCGRPLHPVQFEPMPLPYYEPYYEPEPEAEGVPWWVWVLAATLIMATVLVILAINGNFDTT